MTRPTPAVIGEAGPGAVIPLRGGAGLGAQVSVALNFAAGAISFGSAGEGASDPKAMFREFAETIASEVQRAINAEHRRSALV